MLDGSQAAISQQEFFRHDDSLDRAKTKTNRMNFVGGACGTREQPFE